MRNKLKLAKVHPNAVLPTRGSVYAAGLDLYSSEDTVISPKMYSSVRTGIKVEIPIGYYGRVAPRSGLAIKNGIDVLAGVIDSDYRGEIVCILINHGDKSFSISVGDRIAQIIVESIVLLDAEWVDDLSETRRGTDGFGSTGTSSL